MDTNKMTSTKYLISLDNLKVVAQGALGAMTFGAYHQFTTNKMMELNNESQNSKIQSTKDNQTEMEKRHAWEMQTMRDKQIEMEKRHAHEMQTMRDKQIEMEKRRAMDMDEIRKKLEERSRWW
jgi:hypothetical protein